MFKLLKLTFLLALALVAALLASAILAATSLGRFGTVLVSIVLVASLRSLVKSIRMRKARARAVAVTSFLLILLAGSLEDNRLKTLARTDPEGYQREMAARAERKATRSREVAEARAERAATRSRAAAEARAERAQAQAETEVKQAERERCRDEIEALTYAQLAVQQKLIAPTTADFPWADHRTYQITCGRWRVASYVDSQNAFGAMIRKHWAAEMRWVPESEAWVAEYVHFN